MNYQAFAKLAAKHYKKHQKRYEAKAATFRKESIEHRDKGELQVSVFWINDRVNAYLRKAKMFAEHAQIWENIADDVRRIGE